MVLDVEVRALVAPLLACLSLSLQSFHGIRLQHSHYAYYALSLIGASQFGWILQLCETGVLSAIW